MYVKQKAFKYPLPNIYPLNKQLRFIGILKVYMLNRFQNLLSLFEYIVSFTVLVKLSKIYKVEAAKSQNNLLIITISDNYIYIYRYVPNRSINYNIIS